MIYLNNDVNVCFGFVVTRPGFFVVVVVVVVVVVLCLCWRLVFRNRVLAEYS